MPMEIITEDAQLECAGFYWRATNTVRALSCAPLEEDGFPNAFSTRLGGVSPMPQDALSLAGFNEDAAENIYENRRRFLKLFDGEWSLTACWQVHGSDVRVVKDRTDAREAPGSPGESIYADALITDTQRILLGVKTADCVPVLLCDKRTGACAAIHAGWRGTLARIVSKTLESMREEYGTNAKDVRAAIGPAAGACCYEVGPEVINPFRERFEDADELLTPTMREGHARIDIQRANRQQLIAAGVSPERIHLAPLCTMDRTDLFFSYRREKNLHGRVGRLMSVIGRG
ncbi:MAG TPA: peptidoglycan editing factor PgeF [Pyrinomonadaceae bacterium]|nr:peptidoglycan editing factor PgeF [Pyrinomonadaceae bacterium]